MRPRRPTKRRRLKTEVRKLTVERLNAAGEGLAGDIRVPFALPGEEITATVEGGLARVKERHTDAPSRTKAPCKHFGLPGDGCGGCSLQHMGDEDALALKEDQLLRAVRSVYPDAEISATHRSPPRSRRRAKIAVRPEAAGFYRKAARTIVPLTECHVLRPELFAMLGPLRELSRKLGKPFEAQVTITGDGLDADLQGLDVAELELPQHEALAEFSESQSLARLSLEGSTVAERRPPTVRLGGIETQLPHGVFLQATEEGEAALVQEVLAATQGYDRVADLFSGMGTFALPISQHAEVYAADAQGPAIVSLDLAVKATERAITAEARDLFKRPVMAKDLAAYSAIVFDPPRAGAREQAPEIAGSGAARIVAVSCNPQTLARDLRHFAATYDLTRLVLVDQFGWSPHVEAVAVLDRRSDGTGG
ncbi:class I SAM-dependent RNA methyltransferase [Parvularcula sp. ZS-1/3]|uniref:Class I SAM-dependent RNA methyltransferase n=1 Tax=Parvularcula mediterranea TaxID=2732508 RepID=A0A7Y3RLU0_9PROT|nr:class I SAM-dependent RNA methyltransferase [Parvularcula mediterranea]NNU16384.1 class I SAM-dependent RNA methyltransferase [Parvularcula mediterranea]